MVLRKRTSGPRTLHRRGVAEVDEKYIVFHVEPENKPKDEDDPYADFEVPDDLVW